MQDMVLVNKGGRVVEVPGELGQELLEQGFRVATADEAATYQKQVLQRAPAVLKAKEAKRLKDEQAQAEEVLAQESVQPESPTAEGGQQPVEAPSQPNEAEDTPKKRGSK